MQKSPAFLIIALLTASAGAQSLSGTIEISRKLTKRSITTAIPVYQRGPTVKLGKNADEDPLDFERSHVLVYLEQSASLPSSEGQTANALLRQQDRQFEPDLVIIPVGGAVSFPNMDPIFHNVFSLSHTRTFDLGSFDKGDVRRVVFPKPGIVSVYCHLHPNMSATVFVAPTRWYAQSDRTGHFHIADIPPGRYTVVAWHKAVGSFRQPIQIEPGKDATISFTLPFAAESSAAAAPPIQGSR